MIDGQEEIPTIYGIDRSDVAEGLKNPCYRFSGFSGSFSASKLGKGRHRLSLKILKTFEDGYYEPEQKVEFELR